RIEIDRDPGILEVLTLVEDLQVRDGQALLLATLDERLALAFDDVLEDLVEVHSEHHVQAALKVETEVDLLLEREVGFLGIETAHARVDVDDREDGAEQ